VLVAHYCLKYGIYWLALFSMVKNEGYFLPIFNQNLGEFLIKPLELGEVFLL